MRSLFLTAILCFFRTWRGDPLPPPVAGGWLASYRKKVIYALSRGLKSSFQRAYRFIRHSIGLSRRTFRGASRVLPAAWNGAISSVSDSDEKTAHIARFVYQQSYSRSIAGRDYLPSWMALSAFTVLSMSETLADSRPIRSRTTPNRYSAIFASGAWVTSNPYMSPK